MLLPRTLVPLLAGGEGPSVGGTPMLDVTGGGAEVGEDGTGAPPGGEGGEIPVGLGASVLVGPSAGGLAVGGVDETTGGIAGGTEVDGGGVAVVVGGVAVLVGGVAVVVGGMAVVVGEGAVAVGGVTLVVLGGLAVELVGADDGPWAMEDAMSVSDRVSMSMARERAMALSSVGVCLL